MTANRAPEPAVTLEETESEHALQIQLLHSIEQALEAGDRLRALNLLAQLEDFSDAHFAAEQILMRYHSYPGYQAHELEHGKLLEELRRIRDRIEEGNGMELVAEARAIRKWLMTHIDTADRAFAEFVRGASTSPAAPR
ncbi:MAG: bacteriohemerythrin [Thermoanaerobaculia bacterium]